ncbi:MAG: ATPase [Aphanothece sp. CMT-3BRIN-NPC111]|nr:ATPase [Aphanothece sp. CMT-3BRIN-NPC111]
MSLVLGLDGGGTKTVCLLMDDNGQVLGRGEAGASNYQSVDIQTAFCSIQSAIAQAIASHHAVKIEAICLGLAGVDRPADIQVAHNLVQQLQSSQDISVTWELSSSNVLICNDAAIALVGGLGYPAGIVAIAGTGSIIFGRNYQGRTKRVGGWGYMLGDEGSAYHIAIQGMRAALRAYDGREESTILQERLLQHLGLASLEDLITVVYQRGWGVKEIAALAPIVDRAALEGDQVANSIIEQAVRELVKATQVVIDDLFSRTEKVEIVTTGSVWQSLSKLRDKFADGIISIAPLAKVIYPRYEPAYGAGLLALNTLGISHRAYAEDMPQHS